jgi:hypothetical protein
MPRKKDENQSAFSALEELIRRDAKRDGVTLPPIPPEEKDPKKVVAGKKGGRKGGKARAAKLSKKRRKEIAQDAAKARWKTTENTR